MSAYEGLWLPGCGKIVSDNPTVCGLLEVAPERPMLHCVFGRRRHVWALQHRRSGQAFQRAAVVDVGEGVGPEAEGEGLSIFSKYPRW